MGDLHYIVGKLNAPPYSLGVTLLSFSEKTPDELLQLLSDVCGKIAPKNQRQAAGRESNEQTAERLAAFLRIVKYQAGMDAATFRQLLALGDRDVVGAVLKWLLSQGPVLEKRAFVGTHLSMPDMPEELSYHPEVMELREAVKALQAEFVQGHRALDAAQQAAKQLPQLRAQIKQMEEEKERLGDKVDKAAAQVHALPDAASYRDVCVRLRQEHDREVSISQQLQAQQQQLGRAEASFQRSAGRLREMQQHVAAQGGGLAVEDGGQLLEALQDDVERLRAQVTTRWPRELEGKQRRLAALQEALSNGCSTEGDLQQLLAQESSLRQQVAAAQERQAAAERARGADRAHLQVRQAQQMAALVARRKAELAAKVERLQERRDGLAAALDSSGASGDGAGCSVSDEEWRSRYDSIKGRLPAYRAMKHELGQLEAEAYVLGRTLEVLQQQESGLAARVREVERGAGVPGYSDVATGLDKVSEARSAADEAKGVVLQEHSDTVEQITAAIRKKKEQLSPAINELRALRQQHQDVEAEHAERRAAYDAAVGGAAAAVASLEVEAAALAAEAEAAGAQLAAAQARAAELDAHLGRLASAGGEEVRRRGQAQLAESEAALRSLREQQRLAAEQHGASRAQAEMLGELVALLQLKLQAQASGPGALAGGQGLSAGAPPRTNVMVL